MAMKKYKSYGTDEVSQAMIVLTSLEAGGFNPEFLNYNHKTGDLLPALSQHGLTLMLPAAEFEDATAYLKKQQSNSTQEFGPIEKPKFGKWRRILLVLLVAPVLLLPLFGVRSIEMAARTALIYSTIGLLVWGMLKHASRFNK